MANFVAVNRAHDRGEVTLNAGVIASVRPRTTGHGAFIVCVGGACYTVDESAKSIAAQLV